LIEGWWRGETNISQECGHIIECAFENRLITTSNQYCLRRNHHETIF